MRLFMSVDKKKKDFGDANNANAPVENAVEVAQDVVQSMCVPNISVGADIDVEGVIEKAIDNQNLVIDGKLKAQILQEEKRKNIVAQSEEKRKMAEQEHQHEMEKMRFEKEKEAAKKNGYQVWQEEKRKNIALAEEERRKAAEIENQLILEKERLEVEKERFVTEREQLATERERIALEMEQILLAKEKQKTIRALIIAAGCLIAFFIVALFL